MRTCQSFKNADREITETILQIEVLWSKIQRQLEFLQKIWNTLDEDYQIHQNSVLRVLEGKCNGAIHLIDGIVGDSHSGSSVKGIMAKKGDVRRAK